MSVPDHDPGGAARGQRALPPFWCINYPTADYLAYGTGFHLGNVNMPAMALNVLGYSAAE